MARLPRPSQLKRELKVLLDEDHRGGGRMLPGVLTDDNLNAHTRRPSRGPAPAGKVKGRSRTRLTASPASANA